MGRRRSHHRASDSGGRRRCGTAARLVQNVRTRGLEYTESVDVDVVQVTAIVTDGDGRFVRGLTQADFKVFDDNKPQPITHFAAENVPLELVAAIDVSSSMRDATAQREGRRQNSF